MEYDTSAEIIMWNTDIQQEKDPCKELLLKKGLRVVVGSALDTRLQYDTTNLSASLTVLLLLVSYHRTEMK